MSTMTIDRDVMKRLDRKARAIHEPSTVSYQQVLDTLGTNGLSITELTAELGVNRSQVRDMLSALVTIRAVRWEQRPGSKARDHIVNYEDLDVLFGG